MSEYIEKIVIKVDINTKNVEDSLKKISSSFKELQGGINHISDNISDALSKAFKNSEAEVRKSSQNIKNQFSQIGNYFNKIIGFNSFEGLFRHYIKAVLGNEWFENSNLRRVASNTRSNIMADGLSSNRYNNILFGKGYVGNSDSIQYYYRNRQQQEYDRNILNKNNYFPFTRRWKQANYSNPFDSVDLKLTKDFLNSIDKLRLNLETVTQAVARNLLPIITNIVDNLNKYLKEGDKLTFFIRGLNKGINEVINIWKVALKATEEGLKGTFGILNATILSFVKGVNSIKEGFNILFKPLGRLKNLFGGHIEIPESEQEREDSLSKNNSRKSLNVKSPVINDINYNLAFDKLGILPNNNYYNSKQNNNSINYNIDTIQIRSDAKNMPELINDVRKASSRDNIFLMNNGNFGGIY